MATDVLALALFVTLFSMFFFLWNELIKMNRQQERTADALCEIALALKSMEAGRQPGLREKQVVDEATPIRS